MDIPPRCGITWRSLIFIIIGIIFVVMELLLLLTDHRYMWTIPDGNHAEISMITVAGDDGEAYDVEREQGRRQRIFTETCHQHGLLESHVNKNNRIWLNHTGHVLYCFLPKAANTNLKKMWYYYQGKTPPRHIHNNTAALLIGIDTYQAYRKQHTNVKLSGYYKVVFVRHPWTRLVSGYRDKYVSGDTMYEYAHNVYKALNWTSCLRLRHGLWAKIMKKKIVRPIQTPTNASVSVSVSYNNVRANTTNCFVTFKNFVDHIVTLAGVRNGTSRLDRHWVPQYLVCDMCFLKYDFIGKVEHIHDDFAYMNNFLFNGKAVLGLPRTTVQTDIDMVKNYFAEISHHTFLKLLSIYDMDFKLFDYDTHHDDLFPT